MSVQRLSAPLGALTDSAALPSGAVPVWTSGAVVKVPISVATDLALAQPKPVLLSMSVTITHALGASHTHLGVPIADAIYGKLGKVIGGLDFGGTPQAASMSFTPPVGDRYLIDDIWNPADDPLPQQQPGTAAFPPATEPVWSSASTTVSPAYPLPLDPSSLPVAAVWIFPSLIGASAGGSGISFAHSLATINYSITYDDGLPGA